ncbi:hypothetical protein GMLC_02710 [Geomonas limicola]|uniref:Uncharacterized protein n=1 Tax=Geomonas limicola TaxID=2740186 RepID=A0A6V8N2E9_9BACT|nr:hypothetical protein [Geomonas limicola]GFO66692.1 hypothetical protein GMLC_02710 [Geomonas limicola]
MPNSTTWNLVRVVVLTAVFSAGYLCGSVAPQRAEADLGEIGSDVMKRASESGGTIGTVAKLGGAITDMEKHLSAMQKNLDTLKTVRSALGGGAKN